jgi:hypothetical protein
MNIADKVSVAKTFKELGIEGLPAHTYPCDSRPSLDKLAEDFGQDRALVVRTATHQEERNLPRSAGVMPGAAAKWIDDLPPHLAVIVQPYDEVLFSVEVAVYDNGYAAELVPGIWELGTGLAAMPLT